MRSPGPIILAAILVAGIGELAVAGDDFAAVLKQAADAREKHISWKETKEGTVHLRLWGEDVESTYVVQAEFLRVDGKLLYFRTVACSPYRKTKKAGKISILHQS